MGLAGAPHCITLRAGPAPPGSHPSGGRGGQEVMTGCAAVTHPRPLTVKEKPRAVGVCKCCSLNVCVFYSINLETLKWEIAVHVCSEA